MVITNEQVGALMARSMDLFPLDWEARAGIALGDYSLMEKVATARVRWIVEQGYHVGFAAGLEAARS